MAIPPPERRTGLSIPVATDGLVGEFRSRYNAATVAKRVPPHITVFFPFARGVDVPATYGPELSDHFASFEPFAAELTGVGHFDRFVWLAPEPRDRFADLITATCARFPEFPPYEVEGGAPEPHLTVGAVDDSAQTEPVARVARNELLPRLPFEFEVDSVWLFEEQEDATFAATTRYGFG
jgi:2'-5' RNA ligase